jgi:Family of unknown function (DUF6263)
MKIEYILLSASLLIFAASCKLLPGSSRHYADGDEKKTYRLGLHPEAGAKYYYDVSDESRASVELNGKTVENLNRSQTGVVYVFNRDSAGDIVLDMSYDKIRLYAKNNGDETDLDAARAPTSDDPMEKMLGSLMGARIEAVLSPVGEVKSITGYKEMIDRLMVNFVSTEANVRSVARSRLEQLVGYSIIRKNMEQLFRLFPDSAVHIGDRWKLESQQKGELTLNARSMFTLKDITDGTATIISEGELSADSTGARIMGTQVTPDLKGSQQGEYEMDVHTGMLLRADILAKAEGTVQMMGMAIPMKVEMTVKVKGQRMP